MRSLARRTGIRIAQNIAIFPSSFLFSRFLCMFYIFCSILYVDGVCVRQRHRIDFQLKFNNSSSFSHWENICVRQGWFPFADVVNVLFVSHSRSLCNSRCLCLHFERAADAMRLLRMTSLIQLETSLPSTPNQV